MKKVIIVGTGAVAAELTSYIAHNNRHVPDENQFDLQGYLDFEENIPKYWAKYKLTKPVLGDIHSYQIKEEDHFVVGISNIPFRMKMIEVLKSKNADIINFVHYSTIIADTAEMGIGNIIYPNCIVGPNCKIGDHNVVTAFSFLSHDCNIGNDNFFASAGLSGWVTVKDRNFFGIRSTVLPRLTLGSGNLIQAGMTVDKDMPDNATYYYRFKEKVIAIPKSDT